jgi:hypothetical protein
MIDGFRAVQRNRTKIIYDPIVLACVVLYVRAYVAVVSWTSPPKDLAGAINLRVDG